MSKSQTSEPRTPAGRALLAEYRMWFKTQGWEAEGWDGEKSAASIGRAILAIEAEAAAPDALLREALDATPPASAGIEVVTVGRPSMFATPPASAERDDPYLKALDDAVYVIEQSIATIKGEHDYDESRWMGMSVAAREHVIKLIGSIRVQHPERHESICSCQRAAEARD